MPPTARFIDTNGVRLACDVRGEGPAVALLHAGNVDRRMWDDQLPALAERHRGHPLRPAWVR